jgi:hypothetical protein
MECARLEYSTIEFYEKSGAKVLRDWYVVQMDEVESTILLKIS